MSMSTATVDVDKSSRTVTVPVTPRKRPRILVKPKWRPTKPTSVWPGSMIQLPVGSSTPVAVCTSVTSSLLSSGLTQTIPWPLSGE